MIEKKLKQTGEDLTIDEVDMEVMGLLTEIENGNCCGIGRKAYLNRLNFLLKKYPELQDRYKGVVQLYQEEFSLN